MKLHRAPLFLVERLVSQGGGLIFTALIARTAPPDKAAAFFAAYAFAAVFQPVFSSAVQPLAARLYRDSGPRAFLGLWLMMLAIACLVILPLICIIDTPIGAVLMIHALLAPGLILATPLVVQDRFRALALTLIAVSCLGTTARITVFLVTGDLITSAVLFAIEPIVGGCIFASTTGLFRQRRTPKTKAPPIGEAFVMMATMGATSLFWRSPILIAAAFLTAKDVIAITLAMQIVMGLCLPANALCQSLFGPITQGDDTALGIGLWAAFGAMIGAVFLMTLAGQSLMVAIYGPDGQSAAALALWLAPMTGMAALWRLSHLAAGSKGYGATLLCTRVVALAGQLALILILSVKADVFWIAALTPISMAIGAIAAPAALPGLRKIAYRAANAAWRAALLAPERRHALRLLTS